MQFTKRVSDYWSLVKIAHATTKQPVGKGCYFDEHALRNENTGETVSQPDWEWAEVDGSRIVWAADGKLFAGKLERKGMTRTQQLFDAASVSYAPVAAPY